MEVLDLNQLNETLRILRVQIAAEEMKPKPDLLVLKRLRMEEKQCLARIMD